jgi:predicted transcriptional regulator
MIMEGNVSNLTSWTADIVAAYVANNALTGDKLPEIIGSVYGALHKATVQAIEPPKAELIPAVPVKRSVTHDYIVCLEDGKKFKSLKRHLRTHYDLSPEAYREKWGLPRDYPMVAAGYAAARSELAKSMGLGQKKRAARTESPRRSSASGPRAAASQSSPKAAKGSATKRRGR